MVPNNEIETQSQCLEIQIKEYEILRQEVLNTMSSRASILSSGLVSISILLIGGVAINSISSSILTGLIFILLVPLIITFILFIWFTEYKRSQRAGRYLVGVEKNINNLLCEEVLLWETHLRSSKVHMTIPYNNTVLLLTLISLASSFIGNIFILFDFIGFWVIPLILVGALVQAAIYIYVATSITSLQQ